jgi:hypothetical protein
MKVVLVGTDTSLNPPSRFGIGLLTQLSEGNVGHTRRSRPVKGLSGFIIVVAKHSMVADRDRRGCKRPNEWTIIRSMAR